MPEFRSCSRSAGYANGAPDRRGLVERVVPEAAKAAQAVIDSGGRAGQYLAEAWRHAYGRNPHPGTAYREAVRAIESVVCPIVLPKDPKATLGKVIKALKDAPPGKITSVFSDTVAGVAPLDAVRGLMELVWTNELDRHGTGDEEVPLTSPKSRPKRRCTRRSLSSNGSFAAR
jgi:hypothetical protein